MAWTIGLPFLAVAATAPLLQRWFAGSGHPTASDPYFLYGASNLGSVLALVSYPLLLEPDLTLDDQALLWAVGYGALALAIIGCALLAWDGRSGPSTARAAPGLEEREAVGWPRRLRWLFLALVPSGLLLAVTTHITTDLAAVPLLWVVPLALYLLTYVMAFARRPWLRHAWMVKAQPFVLIPLVLLFTWRLPFWVGLPLHLLGLFVSALVCHGELARLRPRAEHLTEFYFWLALGGAFTALLAPLLFDRVLEYPIALAATCLLRPMLGYRSDGRAVDFVLPLAIGALIAGRGGALDLGLPDLGLIGLLLVYVPSAMALYALAERPLGLGLGTAAALGAALLSTDAHTVMARERSFFGVYTVKRDPAGYHVLVHGTTVHGAQRVEAEGWREPLTYYHRNGPLGQLFDALGARPRAIGVIGLGVGTVACYRRPGQRWTFYEIDPLVERIARAERHFHYLAECAPDAEVRSGDARLTLRTAPHAAYDLLIVDAFSSDAIPMHLITREALAALPREACAGRGDRLARLQSQPRSGADHRRSRRRCRHRRLGAVGSADARRACPLPQPILLDCAGAGRRGRGASGRRSSLDPSAGPSRRAALDRRLLEHSWRPALAASPLSVAARPPMRRRSRPSRPCACRPAQGAAAMPAPSPAAAVPAASW
jgi:hypothetical protein